MDIGPVRENENLEEETPVIILTLLVEEVSDSKYKELFKIQVEINKYKFNVHL